MLGTFLKRKSVCIDSALGRAMIGSFTVHNSRGWLVKTIHCGQRGQIRCGEHSLKEKGACIDRAFGRFKFRHMHQICKYTPGYINMILARYCGNTELCKDRLAYGATIGSGGWHRPLPAQP